MEMETIQDKIDCRLFKAIPIVIQELRAASHQFLTVSELLKLEPSRNSKTEELFRNPQIKANPLYQALDTKLECSSFFIF